MAYTIIKMAVCRMIWSTVRLSILADIIMGQSSYATHYSESAEGLPYFHDMAEFAKTQPHVTRSSEASWSRASEGDILLSVHEPFGQVAIAATDCRIGRGLAALRAKSDLIEQAYLAFFLKYVEPTLSRRGRVASALRRREIAELDVPLPPLSEQRRIIEVLNKIDIIRQSRVAANKKIEAVIPSLFMKIFGEDLISGKTIPLADIVTAYRSTSVRLSSGYRPPSFDNSDTVRHRVGPSEPGHTPAFRRNATRQPFETGDIVIAQGNRCGDYVGQSTVVEEPWVKNIAFEVYQLVQNGGVIHARVDQNIAEPWFVQTYLALPEGRGTLRAIGRQCGIVSGIGREAFLSITVPDISIESQREFSRHARAANKLFGRLAGLSENLNYISSLLLYRALTGDLTARWRESRADSLLREAGEQAAVLKRIADAMAVALGGKRQDGTDLC